MQEVKKQSEAFHMFLWHFFSSLKHNFIAYRSSKVSSRSDCIFEIHQLWQSGFIRVYSICCCSCSFEPEIIKIGQSSHKMYNNNIVNFQESMTILNACTKKSLETYWRHHVNGFECFCWGLAQFDHIKYKFLYWIILHSHMCGFQITHGLKQCTICQCTNYHNITNDRRYLPQLELLWSHDICAAS